MNNFTESLPKAGHVNEVCKEWLVREDGALAYKLQSQEINEFYKGNRFRNAVVREDFPTALNEQIKEKEHADKQAEAYRRRLIEQEEHDKRVAKEIADKLERDLMEQKQKELLESEVIAQQMQEIYVNLPPLPPPVSRDKSRPPPRPAKASTLQQQNHNSNSNQSQNQNDNSNHTSSKADNHHQNFQQQSQSQVPSQTQSQAHPQNFMLQSSHFANNDNYVGISLSPNIANGPTTPSRQKASPQNSANVGNFVVSGDNESPSRFPFPLNHSAERLKQADRSPIILTNEHFLNTTQINNSSPLQQQQQNHHHHHHRHQHSISGSSTSSSSTASTSASARRNVFEYHNVPNNLITPTSSTSPSASIPTPSPNPTKTHSPKHTLNHTPTPTTPNSTQLSSPTLSSNHPDIDELIEYSDVADSIRRYDMSEKKASNKEAIEPSSLKHSNFNRILSPSNENLLKNDKKFQKLSPEKYDQIVGNENGGCLPAAGTAAERYMQEHADDIELYVDPCDYASLKEIGLPMHEIKEMSKKLKQEQKDELLARRLQEMESNDGLTQEERDRMLAIEAQDKELAKMLQEREKAKAKRAKEKARLRKNQQKEPNASSNSSSLCSTSNGLHCGPILPLPQDCLSACSSSSKHSSIGSQKHSPQPPTIPTPGSIVPPLLNQTQSHSQSQLNLSDDGLDMEAYSNPIDVIQNQRSPNGLLTNGSLTRDNTKIHRLQTSQSQDDDIYTLPVDSCRNNGQRPTSLQVPAEGLSVNLNNSMTRSENYSHDLHETTLNGHDISSRLSYAKSNQFDHSSSPTPPYMPIQGSRRLHGGEDRKKKSKDSKCTHQ